MSNKEMLTEILNDEFFYCEVSLVVKTVVFVEGIQTVTSASPVTISTITPQVVSAKMLENLGLGIYTDQENFLLSMATEIDFSKNNYITFEGKIYKVIKALPWRGYGFRKYIMTQYNGDSLNDN